VQVPGVVPFVQPGPPTSPSAFDQPPLYHAQSMPLSLSRLPIPRAARLKCPPSWRLHLNTR